MTILLWIIVGGLAGWIASKIMHTDEEMGIFLNIIVGILGASIGAFLLTTLTGTSYGTFSIGGFITAVLGSILLLGFVKMATGHSRS